MEALPLCKFFKKTCGCSRNSDRQQVIFKDSTGLSNVLHS
jgi:hypothetical protein